MKNYKKIIIGVVLILVLGCIGFYCYKISSSNNITESNATPYDGNTTYIDLTNMTYSGTGVSINNGVITINYGGSYELTGTTTSGYIIINVLDDKDVELIFNNISITSDNVPILIEQGDTKITLKDGTTNYISYTKTYSESETYDGAIYASDDLTIEGTGSLEVKSTYDGIVSKDTLTFNSGNYTIDSDDDAIRGKDVLTINGGNFTINAGGDGLKATNDTDATLGYIVITGGEFNITSANDGIQAETNITIENGTFNIKTTGTDSAKGIKAGDTITIKDGEFTLNTSDDSIHSNNAINISGGTYKITSGDDGIHADTSLNIDGGSITISKSYEGLESNSITINDGTIYVTSSDDGINAASGGTTNSIGMNISGNSKLTINGGYVVVNSTGDGLDANGSIYITGGTVIVNGPTANDNGALDYDSECVVTGGTLISAGSSGMLQAPSTSSTIYSLEIALSTSTTNLITIVDSNDNVVLSFKPTKSTASLVFTSSVLKSGETYSVYVGGTYEGTLTDGIYSNGTYTKGTLFKSATISSKVTTIGTVNNGMRR